MISVSFCWTKPSQVSPTNRFIQPINPSRKHQYKSCESVRNLWNFSITHGHNMVDIICPLSIKVQFRAIFCTCQYLKDQCVRFSDIHHWDCRCNNFMHIPLGDEEHRVAIREQNFPQITSINVSCPEVHGFTNILVLDLILNYVSDLEI